MENIASITLARLAALSGVDGEQITTYQDLGLLPGPLERPEEAGEILHSVRDVEILRVICRASALGFPVSAIADLLSVKRENGTCGDVYTIARRTLDAIRSTGFEPSPDLPRLVKACSRVGGAKNCPVLVELALPLTVSPKSTGYVLAERADHLSDSSTPDGTSGEAWESGPVGKLKPDACVARFRGHAQAARSTAYTVTIESVRAHWLQVAASWDRLADLEELSFIRSGEVPFRN